MLFDRDISFFTTPKLNKNYRYPGSIQYFFIEILLRFYWDLERTQWDAY